MSADSPEKSAQGESRFPKELWVVAALVAWALGLTALLDRSPFGLDEATARVVLLLWSVSDQVPAPIVTLGVPDFRALYLAPAGIVFSGSLIAVKICTLLIYLAAVIGIHRWRVRLADSEAPLLASGLLLIAPIATRLIDRVDLAPFLLLSLALGAWAQEIYRDTRTRFGGWYFAQLLLCMALVDLHPAGLAYPVLLAASWLRPAGAGAGSPVGIIPGSERTHVLAGIAIATAAGLLLAHGWPQQSWFGNPLPVLARDILGIVARTDAGENLSEALGIVLLLALLATLWLARRDWRADALGRYAVAALAIGALCADGCFALLSLVLILHWGFPLLVRVRLGKAAGFAAQRGVAFALLLVASTAFLSADRARFLELRHEPVLSAQDRLIEQLADDVHKTAQQAAAGVQPGRVSGEEKARSGPRVASQWPGRTMIACRCSTLPLPPPSEDPARFASYLRGIGYAVFDPRDPANRELSRSFALLGGNVAETVVLDEGGVVLRLHTGTVADHPPEDEDADRPSTPATKPGN